MARLVAVLAVLAVLVGVGCGGGTRAPSDAGTDARPEPDCCTGDPDGGDATLPEGEDAGVDAGEPPPPEPWTAPDCESITGSPSLTLTYDRGATLLPRDREPEDGFAYTDGLAALGDDGWLLAVSNDHLVFSQDGGCTWTELVVIGDYARVAAGPGRLGFAFGREVLVRFDDGEVTDLSPPADELIGLAVDPTNPDHLRAADDGCNLWESDDGGSSWDVLAPAPGEVLGRELVFDPFGLDVAVCATGFDGALRWQEGAGWSTADGLGDGFDVAILFEAAFSRVNPSMVWVYGNHDSDGRALRGLWLSRDAGRTFAPAVDETRVDGLNNDTFLAPDPFDAGVVWFRARTSVCRYDADDDALDEQSNGRQRIEAVVRLPVEEQEVLVVGLRIEGPIQ